MADRSHGDLAAELTELGVSHDASGTETVGPSEMPTSPGASDTGSVVAAPHGVQLGTQINEGQFTATHLGQQLSMRRDVAIRKTHPVRKHPHAAGRIVGEAWMRGALEHPNVLPVYGVVSSPDGGPAVMTKHAVTATWAAILEAPGHDLGPGESSDDTAWNVRVLIGVCRALEHAHARGLVHRDVKPENVLIDTEGCVYLDGWNLAASLEPDPGGRFPLAADQAQLAGTPAYMAPELAAKKGALVGPRTDVYLVGATLHRVLTGDTPHQGKNVFDVLFGAMRPQPLEYDSSIPALLAAVCRRSMAVEPADRYPTIAALRADLERYLDQGAGYRLAAQGAAAHREFARALRLELDDYMVRELFATAYATLGAAMREVPGDERIVAALQTTISEMARYEAANGAGARAQDLLARLPRPDRDLEERVAATATASATLENIPTQRRDEAAREDVPGRQVVFMATIAVLWAVLPIGLGIVDTIAGLPMKWAQTTAGICWAALFAVGAFLWPAIRANPAVRTVALATVGVGLGSLAIVFHYGADSATAADLVAPHLLLLFAAMVSFAALVAPRLAAGAAAYLVALLVVHLVPTAALFALGVANGIALTMAALVVGDRLEFPGQGRR